MRFGDWCTDVCSSDLSTSSSVLAATQLLSDVSAVDGAGAAPVAGGSAMPSVWTPSRSVIASVAVPSTTSMSRMATACSLFPSLPSPHADNKAVAARKNRARGRQDINNILRLGKRSEEHTSELQSLMRISYAVFCLKQKNHQKYTNKQIAH